MNNLISDRARLIVDDFKREPRVLRGFETSSREDDMITLEEILQRHLKEFARDVQLPAAATAA